jgi:hypothetical protein
LALLGSISFFEYYSYSKLQIVFEAAIPFEYLQVTPKVPHSIPILRIIHQIIIEFEFDHFGQHIEVTKYPFGALLGTKAQLTFRLVAPLGPMTATHDFKEVGVLLYML